MLSSAPVAFARPHQVSVDGIVCGSTLGDDKVNHLHGEFNACKSSNNTRHYSDLNSPTNFRTDLESSRILSVEGQHLEVDGKPYRLLRDQRDFETSFGRVRVKQLKNGLYHLTLE